jgi:flagellar FliL protein
MLFIVPEDDAALDESLKEKALLDAEELKGPDISTLDKDKVELDLDDAPFLEEEEVEEEQPEEAPAAAVEAPAEGPTGLKKLLANKKILFGGIGVLVVVIGVIAWLVLFKSKGPEAPPPPPPAKEEKKPEPKPEPEPPKPEELAVVFEPFWVELPDEKGAPRLLVCKFATHTPNQALFTEIQSKAIVLRDAMYYYLKNKSLVFLTDKKNVDLFKRDMLAVINQYLEFDQINDILIEEYLVK